MTGPPRPDARGCRARAHRGPRAPQPGTTRIVRRVSSERLNYPVDPARDHIRGPDDAPVTLLSYGDFQCPFSRRAYFAIRDLERRSSVPFRFVFRNFPIHAKHPLAQGAAEAAEAAARQDRYWEMHGQLFRRQSALAPDDLRAHAEKVGLDLERFEADVAAAPTAARVDEDHRTGTESGVTGTPSFFVDGARYRGKYDAETLAGVLAAAAGGRQPR